MPSILIVCTANICRSPMAEAIFKHVISRRSDARQWHIQSAGTWARYGAPAALLSQSVMQSMGLDLSAHQSQPVTVELVEQADLVLTMERQQKEGLAIKYPPFKERIFMLSEMVGLSEDVPDPIAGDLSDYQATAKLMKRYLSRGFQKISKLARGKASASSNTQSETRK